MHKLLAWLRNLKWQNYIWLVYLPFILANYVPARTIADRWWIGLLAGFLVLYILVAEIPRWRRVTIPMELLVTGLFAVIGLNNYLIIFPAWQVPFLLGRKRRAFGWFALAYYALFFTSIIRFMFVQPGVLTFSNPDSFGLIFPLISPIMSYLFSGSLLREHALAQTNRRLEAMIQRDERERIARDLHDTLGQSFSMITIKTELAQKLLVKAPEKVSAELADIAATSRQDLQLVREIVNGLHDQSLNEMLLLQDQQLAAAGVVLTTRGETAANDWPTAVQTKFAQTMVECFTNVIRHAHARHVDVVFVATDGEYRVSVQDDGRGAATYARPGSNGVAGMTVRMTAGGGTFAITRNHTGTLVTLIQGKATA